MRWIVGNAGSLGGDPANVSTVGFSAGGNLTAAVAIRANDTGDFRLRNQFICYAPLDLATDPGEKGDAGGRGPERARKYNAMYLGTMDGTSPYVSPLLATEDQLVGLTETTVITGGRDVLKTEALDFARRLIGAGVRVTAQCFPKARHGFIGNCVDDWEEAQQLIIHGVGQ